MRSYRTAIDRKRIQWEEITSRLGGIFDRLPYLRVPHDELARKTAESEDFRSGSRTAGRTGRAVTGRGGR